MDDDKNIEAKKRFCKKYGMELVVLSKRNLATIASTTSIRSSLKEVDQALKDDSKTAK